MRQCAPLYASIAIESFATLVMGLVFSYLLLLITNRGRLKRPGRAVWGLVSTKFMAFYYDIYLTLTKWKQLKHKPLEDRFAFCRKANQGICSIAILIAVLTITRWLHIGNVNGFRYLGYAATCPPMQAELVLLIAPAVPCCVLTCYVSFFITFLMLISGWAASLEEGDLFVGDFSKFMDTWDLNALEPTRKFWYLAPSMSAMVVLTFVIMPYLALLYKIKGGEKGGLPHNFFRLLVIVGVTWWMFPVWWLLSYEGISIITDTKLNAVGFTILNVLSKGAFTFQVISMVKYHKNKKELQEKGFLAAGQRGRLSCDTLPGENQVDALQVVKRKNSKKETPLVWMLRPFDEKTFAYQSEGKSSASEQWHALEKPFRCFLLGRGIYPTEYASKPVVEQRELRAQFKYVFELVTKHVAATNPKGNAFEIMAHLSEKSSFFSV